MDSSSTILYKLLKIYFIIRSIHIFEAVMKIILFCIGILLAILHPISNSFAENIVPIHNVDLVHREPLPIFDYSQNNSLYFDDYLAAIAEDDTNDSERKNFPYTKVAYRIDSFVTSNFSNNAFNSIWATRFFFKLHPSLFIFLRALRL